MGLFTKSIGPVFLKETSDADTYIAKLQNLLTEAEGENANLIKEQISLHDIYLEYGDLAAQIDFLVITRKHIFIIECKNLIGNIEIDNTGAFIRKYEISGKFKREGIYSPITQNQRHLQVLKEVRKSSKKNFISKALFEKNYKNFYHSIVVLANPKTYLNVRYAPKEIKQQVIRADQLITYIKNKDAESQDELSNDSMFDLAKFYLEQNKPERSDYAQKYEKLLQNINHPVSFADNKNLSSEQAVSTTDNFEKNKEDITRSLKEYRLKQSRAEKTKPYYIFTDAQMKDLLNEMPRTKEALLKVPGFGNVKVEKYGDDIIQILWKKG